MITTNLTEWTPSEYSQEFSFRIDLDRGRIYRKETGPEFFSGYRILYVSLDTRLAREWINCNFDTRGLEEEI